MRDPPTQLGHRFELWDEGEMHPASSSSSKMMGLMDTTNPKLGLDI